MSPLIGQHQLAPFTRPAQNERPISSAVVRGVGNTVRDQFNAHDNDAAIHVQSGLLANRPTAGTFGRVFVTYDAPSAPLVWMDNGAEWVSQNVAWGAIAQRPTEFPPAAHSAALITSGVLNDDRLSSNVARRNAANTFFGQQVVVADNGIAFRAGEGNGVFMEFYPRTAAPTTRWGTIGFLGPGNTVLQMNHEQGGDVTLSSGTARVTLKGGTGRFEIPSGMTLLGAVNYTWPLTDGSSGFVLKTDGAGTLSWAPDTGGTGGGGGSVAWVDITGRPATFTPSPHTHAPSDITAGQFSAGVFLSAAQLAPGDVPSGVTVPWARLTGVPPTFPPSTHTQPWTTITGVPPFLPADWNSTVANRPATFPPSPHRHNWSELDNIPPTFPPSAHTHLWAQITDKPTVFPPQSHGHPISEVTGLQGALDSKTTQGGTGTFANGTVGGNPLAGIIVSTAAPSGSAVAGTIWARV